MELARLFVRIDGDTRGLDRSLDRTERRMEAAGQKAEGTALAFGAIGAAALGAAGGVTMAAAKFERLELALENTAGSELEAARQLRRLHEIAKRPGIDFEGALKGSVRLQEVDLSARLAERSVAAFGNAIASAGGTKDDLNGVIVALSQIASKGKVSAEEIQQIAERVPQIRAAMQGAFGTSDTEVLQRRGISPEEFIEKIVAELEKLPPVAGGAQNSLQNLAGGAERAAAAIGDKLLPVVTPVTNVLGDLANAFADSDEAQRIMTDGVILLAGALAGRLAGGATKAAAAKALQARESLALARAEQAEAGASLAAARAAEADAQAKVADLQATRQAIVLARQEASAVLARANAYRVSAAARVPIESLAPLGAAAVERELHRRAKATEDVSRATRELATLGQQQARVDREIARAQLGVAAASGVVEARQNAVAAAATRASIASRAATVAMTGLRTVFTAMGGWVGIGITALTAFGLALAARKREVEEFADSVREVLVAINGDVAGMTGEQLDAHIAELENRLEAAKAGLARFGEKAKAEANEVRIDPTGQRMTRRGVASEGTRAQVQQYTRDVLALGQALREAQARREALDKASGDGGGGGTFTPTGAAGLDGSLATLRAVVEMQDEAREELRGLELELAFETQADRAEKLREKIAETTAQIQAMDTAIRQMGGRAALQDPVLGLARGSQPKAPGENFRWEPGLGKIANLQTHPALSKLQETADTTAESLSGMEKATAVVEDTLLSVGDAVGDFFSSNLDPKLILSNLATGAITTVLDRAGSLIQDVFTESPEEKAARMVQVRNTQALERLTAGVARLGDVLRSTAGGDVAGVRAAAVTGISAWEAADHPLRGAGKGMLAFRAELAKLGLTFEDATEIAAGYGITLDGSMQSWRDFVEAVDQVKLGDLFKGAAGQADLLERRFGLFDMGDQEQLEARRRLFLEQANLDAATEAELSGFDLSTAEGRQGFEDALRRLFEMAPSLSLGQLGGLSPDQFLEFISGMDSANDALQELAESADKVSGSMRNVPTGFRYALAVFNASAAAPAPGSVTGYGTSGSRVDPIGTGGPRTLEIHGPINVYGVQDSKAMLAGVETQAIRKQRRGGVTLATEIR